MHVEYAEEAHHFTANQLDAEKLAETLTNPLSVIIQVTRRCNLSCVFCSETQEMKDPTIQNLITAKNNLAGVRRVFISGGEPLMRADILDILGIFSDQFIVGLPTNASPRQHLSQKIAKHISFINIGIEGPRKITNALRGGYDKAIEGAFQFKKAGIPLSFSCVLTRTNKNYVESALQIADIFNAGKLKLILPIRKGNALTMQDAEFLSNDEAIDVFRSAEAFAADAGLRTKLRLTIWDKSTEGYSLVIFPDGSVNAWPVFQEVDKILYLGNIFNESISDIWLRYPFKRNHVLKYTGNSIYHT